MRSEWVFNFSLWSPPPVVFLFLVVSVREGLREWSLLLILQENVVYLILVRGSHISYSCVIYGCWDEFYHLMLKLWFWTQIELFKSEHHIKTCVIIEGCRLVSLSLQPNPTLVLLLLYSSVPHDAIQQDSSSRMGLGWRDKGGHCMANPLDFTRCTWFHVISMSVLWCSVILFSIRCVSGHASCCHWVCS